MAQEKAKLISIKEFKMWLQGVEEMQASGWTPDARQWERIRAKLDLIDDTTFVQPVYRGERNPTGLPLEAVFPPLNPNPPGSGGEGFPTPAPSSLNVPTAPRPTRTVATPTGLPVTMTGGAPVPGKTPNIDTSHGKPYTSNFS